MRQVWNADNNPGTPTLRMSILWRACHSGRGRRRHSQTLRSGLLSSPTIPAWLASSNHYPCARLGCTREALGYGNFCSSISSYIFHASSFCGAPVMHICARPINMTNYFCALASVSSRPRPLVANVICFRVLQLCFVYPPCLLHIFVSFLQFPLLGFTVVCTTSRVACLSACSHLTKCAVLFFLIWRLQCCRILPKWPGRVIVSGGHCFPAHSISVRPQCLFFRHMCHSLRHKFASRLSRSKTFFLSLHTCCAGLQCLRLIALFFSPPPQTLPHHIVRPHVVPVRPAQF